jgi:hypothetical protein
MTEEDDPQRLEDFLFDKLSDGENPEDLARYIEEGGELTAEMRTWLAELIRKKAPKARANKDPKRDLEVYWTIEAWRRERAEETILNVASHEVAKDRPATSKADNFPTQEMTDADFKAAEDRLKLNYPSLQEAFRYFSSDGDNAENKLDAVQKQYERGRKLARSNTTSSHAD